MYSTLAKLPIVIFEEISETGNLELLLFERETLEPEALAELWQKLSIEFSDKSQTADSKRNFRLQKEIDMCYAKHKTIMMMIECLRFDWDNELVAKLRYWGYTVTQHSYHENIDSIERESNGLLVKAANLKSMLPKQEQGADNVSIYDVIASYSSVLSIDFGDYEKISCLKYVSIQKQVASKIKSSERTAEEKKRNSTKNRR